MKVYFDTCVRRYIYRYSREISKFQKISIFDISNIENIEKTEKYRKFYRNYFPVKSRKHARASVYHKRPQPDYRPLENNRCVDDS